MCVYAYVYVCVCTCIYVLMYLCMYVCMYVCILSGLETSTCPKLLHVIRAAPPILTGTWLTRMLVSRSLNLEAPCQLTSPNPPEGNFAYVQEVLAPFSGPMSKTLNPEPCCQAFFWGGDE